MAVSTRSGRVTADDYRLRRDASRRPDVVLLRQRARHHGLILAPEDDDAGHGSSIMTTVRFDEGVMRLATQTAAQHSVTVPVLIEALLVDYAEPAPSHGTNNMPPSDPSRQRTPR